MEEAVKTEEPSTMVSSTVESKKRFNSGPYVVGILLFLVICLLAALTYFILKDNGIDLFSNKTVTTKNSENSSSNSSTTESSDDSGSTNSDVCVSNKDAILNQLSAFEIAQKNRDANTVISLFTSATEASDISDYNTYINGYLYSNMSSDYKLSSYTVKSGPEKKDDTCLVVVVEQRVYYGGPVIGEWLDAAPYELSVAFVQSNNQWKIDTYESDNSLMKSGKYQGFLMQDKYDKTVSVVYEGDASVISSDYSGYVAFREADAISPITYIVPKSWVSLGDSSIDKGFTLSYDSTNTTEKLEGMDSYCIKINGAFSYEAQ